MSSPHLDQLLLAAQQSGLITAADLEQLTAESLTDKSPTQEALAAELVNRRLLSSYQAELLLSGRAAVVRGDASADRALNDSGQKFSHAGLLPLTRESIAQVQRLSAAHQYSGSVRREVNESLQRPRPRFGRRDAE